MELISHDGVTLYEQTYGRPYSRTSHSLASDVRDLVSRGSFTDREAWRYAICQAIDTYASRRKWGHLLDAAATFTDEPPKTGHQGLDAAAAALAEYFANRDGWDLPDWAVSSDRVAREPWIVASLPSARVQAAQHSPEEFGRRGVYVSPDDLVRL